jgi:hypothetical protein
MPTAGESYLKEPDDFSLVLGGPLYQLWRKVGLAGDTPKLLTRRVIGLTAVAWLPPLLLSIAEGAAWGGRVRMPFLYDVQMHVRMLLALPLLVVAELVVNQRLRPTVRCFVERGLVPEAARARFDAAIGSAMRLRNSVAAEVLLVVLVYVVGVGFVWRTQVALDVATWYGAPADGGLQPSLAGWWLGFVSLPVFQFLLLRWYFRLFIWARFLWQVSRIGLALVPTHPDRCAGLGFLSLVSFAYSPLLLAQGTLLAGTLADQIFYAGARLPQFRVEIAGFLVVMLFAVLGPMLVFIPALAAAKRTGLTEYGSLAQRYVREFDQKWLRGGATVDEPLVGSGDIQSLADLGNSFEVVKSMRLVPFNLQTVVQLAVVTLVPVLPLTLTMFSPEQLLEQLVKMLF